MTFIAMFKPKKVGLKNGSDKEPKTMCGIHLKVWIWIAIVFTVVIMCGWFFLQLQIQDAVGY